MKLKTNLSDFTDSASNNAPVGKKHRSHSTDPNNQKQRNGPICPTYHEERSDPRWKEILNEHLYDEPACGHAIDYLRANTGTTLAPKSAANYCGQLCMYINFLHDRGVNVCQADAPDLRAFIDLRVREGRSTETITADRTAISNLYKHIELYRDADPNLTHTHVKEVIKPSAYRTKDRIEREPLSKQEIIKLFDAVDNLRNRLILQVGVELGPRNVDICNLKTSSVDLDERTITLTNTKASGEYTLPISRGLSLLLRRWIEVERPASGVAEDNSALFPSDHGGSLSTSRIRQIVSRAAEKAGIQKVVGEIPITENQKKMLRTDQDVRNVYRVDVHTLRHTFNHLLTEAGVPREARSAALDHSTTSVTKDFYDHQENNYLDLVRRLFKGVLDFDFEGADTEEDE